MKIFTKKMLLPFIIATCLIFASFKYQEPQHIDQKKMQVSLPFNTWMVFFNKLDSANRVISSPKRDYESVVATVQWIQEIKDSFAIQLRKQVPVAADTTRKP